MSATAAVTATITARLLLGSRRTMVVGLVLLLPILIAVIFRASGNGETSPTEFALDLVEALILTVLLPLVALVLGTTALGSEIEDGTIVFMLSKPIDRWRVLVVKAGVAAAATSALAVPATVATAWIIVGSPSEDGLVPGLGLAALVASVVYSVVFVALSTITSRALVVGLVYVFVWESTLTNLFTDLAWVSVRQYGTGWAAAVITAAEFDHELSTPAAVIMSLLVVAVALVVGSNRLSAFEIGERA